jgi:hypothetical protein
MASDDKKVKTNAAPGNEALPENKSTSGTEPSKVDGGELAAASPSGYSRGEGQKPVSKAYQARPNSLSKTIHVCAPVVPPSRRSDDPGRSSTVITVGTNRRFPAARQVVGH